jgi:hypothetical protein
MAIKDGIVGGSGAETGRVGEGSKGISGIKSGLRDGGPDKASKSSGYPGFQDSTPSEGDKTQSAP